ncbi:MAG: hypothetical protein M3198_14905 [Actinomycetota bacterium]|nr:hypothetical protein [Actinomycetota bacterium]
MIIGTNRDDQIWGGPADDFLYGRGGADAIKGMGGNDIICGGGGHDGINGNGDPRDADPDFDNDVIEGGMGRDFIVGADGNDTILGGPDASNEPEHAIDFIYGGPGDDTLSGGTVPTPMNPRGDDRVVDYIAGGDGTDVITEGEDDSPDDNPDEVYPDIEPDKTCAAEIHTSDPHFDVAKAGTWSPGRLTVNHDDRPCMPPITGEIRDWKTTPNDGDAKFNLPRERPDGDAVAVLLLEVTEVVQEPDPCRETRIARGDMVRVEFMPRDFGADLGDDDPDHFPVLTSGQRITVVGLCVNDTNPGHENHAEIETEIHPAYYVRYQGVDYYSGKKYAGSPIKMHPCSLLEWAPNKPECGLARGTRRNTQDFDGKKHRRDWRYCWDENGNPCKEWGGRPSFG